MALASFCAACRADWTLAELSSGSVAGSACHPDDVLIRYGGEEFAILVQAPNISQAVEVTERIRFEFAREPTNFEGLELTHTLTAGIALAVSPEAPLDRTEAIRRADAALYEGKRQGRNRSVSDATA